MNHALLEKKIAGFDTLFQFLKVFKKDMLGYLELIAPIVKNNLDNKHSSMVRKLGVKCLYYLMLCCQDDVQMAAIFNDFAEVIIIKANEYMTIENEQEGHAILKKLLKSAKMFKSPLISEIVMTKWFEALDLSMNLSIKLKSELKTEQSKEEEIDEAAQEEFDERFEAANQLLQIVMDTTCMFMRLYKENVENIVINKFGGAFYNISKNATNEEEIHLSLCFYADLMENCSETSMLQGYEGVANSCLGFWPNAKDINCQHTCAFLMGVLAKRVPADKFMQYLQVTVTRLLDIVNHPECYGEERADFTDNALGALGKICLYQLTMDHQDSVGLMDRFLGMMPLHHDSVEAQAVNKMFLEEISKKNKNLVPFEAVIGGVLMRMNEFVRTKPELEILDDIGSNLLKQVQN